MKTFKKTAMAAVVTLFALFLITCVEDFPESAAGDSIEYLDWKYEDNPNGTGKLTLMLDGTTPFAYKKSRGLNVEMAKMIHDYFEAVFVNATGVVSRTTWEIGYPAGISGLVRDISYGAVTGNNSSTVFVGKRQGKTLLGIGYLVEVKEGNKVLPGDGSSTNTTVITRAATSVTYAVYSLSTAVGWSQAAGNPFYPEQTFITAVAPGDTPDDPLTVLPAPAAPTTGTSGKLIPLPGGVYYPLFDLPEAVADREISAKYTIGGLGTGGTPIPNPAGSIYPTKPNLWAAAIVSAPLEIIKRYAAYQVQGQTFDASKSLDTYTKVDNLSNLAAGVPFDPEINMTFTQTAQSNGIFAITFQCPVYAISDDPSANSGGTTNAERWYIRPGYNQYQYLLDNGTDAGGMVMLGRMDAGSTDWLEIFTTGVGFTN